MPAGDNWGGGGVRGKGAARQRCRVGRQCSTRLARRCGQPLSPPAAVSLAANPAASCQASPAVPAASIPSLPPRLDTHNRWSALEPAAPSSSSLLPAPVSLPSPLRAPPLLTWHDLQGALQLALAVQQRDNLQGQGEQGGGECGKHSRCEGIANTGPGVLSSSTKRRCLASKQETGRQAGTRSTARRTWRPARPAHKVPRAAAGEQALARPSRRPRACLLRVEPSAVDSALRKRLPQRLHALRQTK